MWGTVYISTRAAKRQRKIVASLFFGTLVPLVYLYIHHKVHRVPGGELSFDAEAHLLR